MLLNNSTIIPITRLAIVPKLIVRTIASTSNLNQQEQIQEINSNKNKRNKNKNKKEILNKLISLYHLSLNFSPLNNENNKLNNYINHNLIPIDKNILRLPEPLNLLQLTRNKNQLYHEIEKINSNSSSNSTLLTSQEINLTKSIQTSLSNHYLDSNYSESFEKINILGTEPPLSNRMRRIMDSLYGTNSGGQAGFETLLEKGPSIMRLEVEKREEREREEREEQEALEDERLVEEARLGV